MLYVKPRNTLAAGGDPVEMPAAVAGARGRRLPRRRHRPHRLPRGRGGRALDHVAGFLIVNDVSVPHPNYFRPAVRYKARDGFCPLGPRVTPRAAVATRTP